MYADEFKSQDQNELFSSPIEQVQHGNIYHHHPQRDMMSCAEVRAALPSIVEQVIQSVIRRL